MPCYRSCGKVVFLHMSVILSTGGVSALVHAGIHPPGRHPPPRADTPPGRHPLDRHPPRQTPPGRHPPGRHSPPSRRQLLWTVRIPLECILVNFCTDNVNILSWYFFVSVSMKIIHNTHIFISKFHLHSGYVYYNSALSIANKNNFVFKNAIFVTWSVFTTQHFAFGYYFRYCGFWCSSHWYLCLLFQLAFASGRWNTKERLR